MKKTFVLLLIVAVIFGLLVGCAPKQSDDPGKTESPEGTEPSKEGGYVIGYALTDLTNSFYINMREAGDVAAEDYGATVIWKSSEGSLDTQISIVENFIEQGVDIILIDPIDKEGVIPVIGKAADAGIPFMTVGNFVDTENNRNILYNDYNDTFRIAEIMAKAIDFKGTVGLIYGSAGNFVSDQRQAGFKEGMAQYPDIKVVEAPGGWDAATGMTATADIIAANPDLVGLHSVSDDQTYGALQAIETAGLKDKIVVTSYDGSVEANKLVDSGEIMVDLLTGAKRVGYYSVQVAVRVLQGEDVPIKNYMSSHFVMTPETKATVTEWGLADNISIVTGAEAIELFDAYQADFNPEAAAKK